MPPRTARKTMGGPGSRRGGRGGSGTAKARVQAQTQMQPEVDEPLKAEEQSALEVQEEVTAQPSLDEKPWLPPPVEEQELVKDEAEEDVKSEQQAEIKLDDSWVLSVKEYDDAKDSVEEYEKGERLDLDDNDPEYEPEEYASVDYDEKEMDHEDVVGEGDEVEEEPVEDEVGGEADEGDMVEKKTEDADGDVEGDEDDEHVMEEHTVMVDHAEEEEQHHVVKERLKRKEFEIFVGGLDKEATEDDLRKVFSEVGEVTEVRLLMNSQTKKNKGFAFLRFATVEQAKQACTELKNPVVHGKQCGVSPSQDSDTLFLGNICKTWTKDALKEKLKHYGIENIEDLMLVEDTNNAGMNRGFAFLEFSSRSDAKDAFKRLQNKDVIFGVDRPAKVSFADSFVDPGDEIMSKVKTLFVDGLPASWDEDHVRDLLKKYGEIEKIELARNMPSAKRKDFGFVTFSSHAIAVSCAESINNKELGEGESKAKVRARLSRPLQRGKGKYVNRGDSRQGHPPIHSVRGPWSRLAPRSIPIRTPRGVAARLPPGIDRDFRRPSGLGDRRQVTAVPPRARPLAPPARSYDRRPHIPSYPKSSMQRDYVRREELPPRNQAAVDYSSRVPLDRRMSYRDDYSSRGSGYPELPRVPSHTASRRDCIDDGYGQRYDRPPPTYHEGRGHEYDSMSGSKRPYFALDDVPPRYADMGVRHSRARLDYELGSSAPQYGDTYIERVGRSNLGYGGSRSSMSIQDPHGIYSSRRGMAYGGSYDANDVGGMYSSGFDGDYISHGGDVGGSSYSSQYSNRGMGGSNYMGSGGSGSYY